MLKKPSEKYCHAQWLPFFKKICIILVFNFISCSAERYQVNIKPSRIATKFPPIKNYSAELDCVSPKRTFYNDEAIKLTFRLTNLNKEKLIIYEWMRKQEDNILIRFTKFTEDTTLPQISDWHLLKPEISDYPPRQTLELFYQNSVLIDKTFTAEELNPDKNHLDIPFKIALVAELNLNSLKLQSRVIVIEIRNRGKVYSD